MENKVTFYPNISDTSQTELIMDGGEGKLSKTISSEKQSNFLVRQLELQTVRVS